MKNKTLLFALSGILFLTLNTSYGIDKKKVQLQVPMTASTVYNIRDFGAKGDGKTLDSPSINKAIEEAAAKGGGTVWFPAGIYLSVSIRLKSNISLYIDQGATILAASTSDGYKYDPPEPNVWGDSLQYQDFGHSHWHNSLIWGENLENISILGPGVIWGKGLVRGTSKASEASGNKSIALKWCRNVIMRDFSILMGGWLGILATGVDNLTIDNLKIDTNRDGMDIDCCVNVRILNCSVNSPRDDGICLKSSFGLGVARATENVTITNCQVSGFTEGTFLDGTFERNDQAAGGNGPTGRIKFGTESNGGFKNITISNCVFNYCRGLALETVYNADPRYGCILSGDPGHDIKDIRLSNIRIYYKGGGTSEQAAREVPGYEKEYPEPYRFGTMPSYGYFIRHADGIQLDNIEVSFMEKDSRPAFFLDDVKNADFMFLKAQKTESVPSLSLRNVVNLSLFRTLDLSDRKIMKSENEKF